MQHKVYVEVKTSHKVTGWGEVSALVPAAAEELARALFSLIDGENPTRIEHLWQKMYRAHRDMRGGPFMSHTIAGIDMALWDITGKLWGVPVHRLLGGPCRDRVRVYPTAKAEKVPPHGIYEHSGRPSDVRRMVDAIKAARERVGPDGTVMFDAHCAVPPATLIQLASALKAYDVLFIEEPAVPGNIEVFKRLKEAIDIPLATGERDRAVWEFVPYLHERAVDVLQPDVAHCGGITAMKKIAVLAEAYHVPLAPHCTTSPLGATASLSVAASVPLLLIHETSPGALKWGEAFMESPLEGRRGHRLRHAARRGQGSKGCGRPRADGRGGLRPEVPLALAGRDVARRVRGRLSRAGPWREGPRIIRGGRRIVIVWVQRISAGPARGKGKHTPAPLPAPKKDPDPAP